MSQFVLISRNEIINSLYEVNLRAYVGCDLSIKKSVSQALSLIRVNPRISGVICFLDKKNNSEALERLLIELQHEELEIPVICLGELETKVSQVIEIKNKYDIKQLLGTVAKMLGITATDMSQKEVSDYFPVPLNLFLEMPSSHCDVYSCERDEADQEVFSLEIRAEQKLGDVVKKFQGQGIDSLYVPSGERLKFINRASKLLVNLLENKDIPSLERVQITHQIHQVLVEEILDDKGISQELADISRSAIKSIEQVCADVPKLKDMLKMLAEKPEDYCFKHSILASYIARLIINNISWGSDQLIGKVSFAFFFHDIYLVPIYRKYPDALREEELLYRSDVSEEDKQTVLDHAKNAGELVQSFPRCPMGADMIITQHHGMSSGHGFAANCKDDISPPSKIMLIAEEASLYLIEKRVAAKEKVKVNKEDIVSHLREMFKNHTYQKVIDAFAKANF